MNSTASFKFALTAIGVVLVVLRYILATFHHHLALSRDPCLTPTPCGSFNYSQNEMEAPNKFHLGTTQKS